MFVKYFTKNIAEQEKFEKYCNSKTEIWRWFFGWRGTKNETMCYKISKKVLEKNFRKENFLKILTKQLTENSKKENGKTFSQN